MNELSHDEKIALALTSALIQARAYQQAAQGTQSRPYAPRDTEDAVNLFKQVHGLIANSPESKARRGFSQ